MIQNHKTALTNSKLGFLFSFFVLREAFFFDFRISMPFFNLTVTFKSLKMFPSIFFLFTLSNLKHAMMGLSNSPPRLHLAIQHCVRLDDITLSR